MNGSLFPNKDGLFLNKDGLLDNKGGLLDNKGGLSKEVLDAPLDEEPLRLRFAIETTTIERVPR